MSTYPELPKLELKGPEVYRLTENYHYVTRTESKENRITVRRGFVCDLASIPGAARWLIKKYDLGIGPPLIHDMLYACQGTVDSFDYGDRYYRYNDSSLWYDDHRPISRREADLLFYRHMIDSDIPHIRANLAYYGVRIGAISAWKAEYDPSSLI